VTLPCKLGNAESLVAADILLAPVADIVGIVGIVVGIVVDHRAAGAADTAYIVAGPADRIAKGHIAGHIVVVVVVVHTADIERVVHILFVLPVLLCQWDCHSRHKNVRRERFAVRNWCKCCWQVLPLAVVSHRPAH
jgi:hypothetical protein